MAKKTWAIILEKKQHTVEYDPGGWRSKSTLLLDGKPVELTDIPKTNRFPMFTDSLSSFRNHELLVRMSTNGFYNSYELFVDRVSTASGLPLSDGPYIPNWAWIFFLACLAVAFMSLDQFILSIVAMLTGFGCLSASSNPNRRLSIKIATCSVFTILAWAVYFML